MQKIVLVVVLLLSLAVAALAKTNAVESFLSFKTTHSKEYSSPEEETYRFEIFQNNIRLAEQWNRELNTDAFGVSSPFSDMTQEEFAEQYLMNPVVVAQAIAASKAKHVNSVDYAPKELLQRPPLGVSLFDWSLQNPASVTPVKDQGQCGSCWAFSATETLESQWVINGNSQVVLAPQEYVDCTYNYDGCDGGWYTDAWSYAMSTTGQAAETSYPYQAVYSGGCQFNPSTAQAQASGFVNIPDENSLLNYVTYVGPASVAVDASRWYLYNGGGSVYPAQNCTGGIDHAVVVTGYTNVNGQDVWTVRNSWNTWWGNAGYIYVPMGSNACSIGSYAAGVQTPWASQKLPSAKKRLSAPAVTRRAGSRSATRAKPASSRSPQPPNPFPVAACVDQINKYRAQTGAPALTNNTAENSCVNGQSKTDYTQNKAHYAFGTCGEYGQCECPGWGNTNQILDCLAMMFAEGPPPAGGFNHYSIMTDPGYKSVSCGFYDNGAGVVWMTQDYFY